MDFSGFKGCLGKHPVLSVFSAAFLARIMLFYFFPSVFQHGADWFFYNQIADSVLSGRGFGELYFNPVWPIFLVFVEVLLNRDAWVMVFLQSVLAGLLASAIYLLAFYVWKDRRRAFLSGLIIAVWPNFLIQSVAYGESLFLYTLFLVLWVYFLLKSVFEKNLFFAFFSGIFLGFASLTESITFYYVFIILVWGLAVYLMRNYYSLNVSFTAHFLRLLVLFAAFSLVIAPWFYRNITVTKEDPAPLIAKHELVYLKPSVIKGFSDTFVHPRLPVLIGGIEEMFFSPHNISLLHPYSDSYKKFAMAFVTGSLTSMGSNINPAIFLVKAIFTLAHWFLLALAFFGFLRFYKESFIQLAFLLLIFTVTASLGYGMVGGASFENVAPLSGFLFFILPFLAVISAPVLSGVLEKIRVYVFSLED